MLFTSLHFTLLYFTLLYFTLLYFTLLYFTLLYFTVLCFALLYVLSFFPLLSPFFLQVGRTALMAAASAGHDSVVSLLLSDGKADRNITNNVRYLIVSLSDPTIILSYRILSNMI